MVYMDRVIFVCFVKYTAYIYIFNRISIARFRVNISEVFCFSIFVHNSTFYSDMVYCGVYDNALDNDNYNIAKGFNYHQGPVCPLPTTFNSI